jgi:hypothetical protein
MKINRKLIIGLAVALAMCGLAAQAQSLSLSSIQSMLKDGVITIGQPVTIKGQTFLVTTNAAGNYVIFTQGVGGTATVTPPTTTAEALSQAQVLRRFVDSKFFNDDGSTKLFKNPNPPVDPATKP